jgi:hypothetical protein
MMQTSLFLGFYLGRYNSELVKGILASFNTLFVGGGIVLLVLAFLLLAKQTFQKQSDRAEQDQKLLLFFFVGAITFMLMGASLYAVAHALP